LMRPVLSSGLAMAAGRMIGIEPRKGLCALAAGG
jgi:hypothetical protein